MRKPKRHTGDMRVPYLNEKRADFTACFEVVDLCTTVASSSEQDVRRPPPYDGRGTHRRIVCLHSASELVGVGINIPSKEFALISSEEALHSTILCLKYAAVVLRSEKAGEPPVAAA